MPEASTTSRNNVTEPNTSRSGDGEVRGSGQRNMAVGLTEQREVSCRSNRRGAPRETEREATATRRPSAVLAALKGHEGKNSSGDQENH